MHSMLQARRKELTANASVMFQVFLHEMPRTQLAFSIIVQGIGVIPGGLGGRNPRTLGRGSWAGPKILLYLI